MKKILNVKETTMLRNFIIHDDAKFNNIVELERGRVRKLFGVDDVARSNFMSEDFGLRCLDINFKYDFSMTKRCDKIKPVLFDVAVSNKFARFGQGLAKQTESSIDYARRALGRRMELLFIFASSAVIDDSKAPLYKGRLKDFDIILEPNHKELNNLIKGKVDLGKDIIENVRKVFNFFWYYFPDDLTGMDKEIIQLSLKQNVGLIINE